MTSPKTQPTEKTSFFKSETFIGGLVVFGVIAAIVAIVVFVQSNVQKIVYEPVNACEAFTMSEASDVIGSQAIPTTNQAPTLSGNLATSKCGYTDNNSATDEIYVAALTIRSGVDDAGSLRNKNDFATAQANAGTTAEAVEDLGDGAFYNYSNGQLNVLRGHDWMIISYGAGEDPQGNKLEDAVKMAKLVLN